MQPSNRRGLLPGVLDSASPQLLFDLKDSVDAFRWQDSLALAVVQEWGVLAVVDHEVYLFALGTARVHDEPTVNVIPLREVHLQDLDPFVLRGRALRDRVGQR